MTEQNYQRVNWQARKTPISAVNLNHMEDGIVLNRSAIQELQLAIFNEQGYLVYPITLSVPNKYELPQISIEGAYYYVSEEDTIYQGVNSSYRKVGNTIKYINGGGAQ